MNGVYRLLRLSLAAILTVAMITTTLASVPARIGPYRLQIYSEPSVIPVGKARIRIDITDASGNPVEGAEIRSLVQMPSMNMGEKESPAQAIPGTPGSYIVDASFGMAGRFEASLSIRGPLGDASGKVSLETGQNTGSPDAESSGRSYGFLMPWIAGVLAVAVVGFVLFRMRRTGQRISMQPLRSREVLGGLLLLALAFVGSRWAIQRWQRPGSMTPLEAQSMEMNLPAPAGVAMVTLGEATLGPIENTVSYPGQAIAYNEQDVVIRSEGWLREMPFYVGQRVREDEVVAVLDISDLQAFAELQRMQAELSSRNEGLDAAAAEIEAARQERSGAEADLASKQSMIAAADADREYWDRQNTRNKSLLDKGAISPEEYQRDFAMTQQAKSRLEQAQAEMRAAQAMLRRSDAMVTAAEKRRLQMASDVTAAEAAVRSAEARAGYDAPHNGPAPSRSVHGHVEIRAHLAGVVTARPIGLGQHVGPGVSIMKIVQTDPIRLQANVAEADLARIKVGAAVSVRGRSPEDPPLTARVTAVASTVEPATRTGIVEAVVANGDMRFTPGRSLELAISTGRVEEALRVPLSAVHTKAETGEGPLASGSARYVWVAEKSAEPARYTVTPVDVTTGVSDGQSIQIVAGLEPGQKVVVSGAQYLKRGDAVAVAGEREATR